jgi:hypothetical protein
MKKLNETAKRANKGDRIAQWTIEQTFGHPPGSYSQLIAAAIESRDGALRGEADAMVSLGHVYFMGLGFDKNIRLAEHWYKEAANKGNLQGLYELGKLYFATQGDHDRAKAYIMAAVNTSIESGEPIPGVPPEEVASTLQTLAELSKLDVGAQGAAKGFAAKIDELRWHFSELNLLEKQKFIENLQNNPPEDTKNHPKFRKFVNECIENYNTLVKRHNSEVKMQDLLTYYDGLNLPKKLDFIQKLQETPPEIKSQPRYRNLANKCIADYNAEVRRRNLHVLDIERAGGPKAVSLAKISKNVQKDEQHMEEASRPEAVQIADWSFDGVRAQLDAQVEQLHYYGSSCDNCRFLDSDYCDNFSRILSRWKERGYNVCQKWERH